MSASTSVIQRIPVTAGLAGELSLVGASAARRARGPVLAIAPAIWIVLVMQIRGEGLVAAVLIATALIAALLAWIFLFAKNWGGQVASEPYIVRERGPVSAAGAFKAFMTGEKTERSLKLVSGRVHLDSSEAPVGLEGLWRTVRDTPRDVLDVDYTPHRYLLAVRDPSGRTLFARAGYEPPPDVPAMTGPAVAPVEPWSAALRPSTIGLASIIAVVPVTALGMTVLDPAGPGGLAIHFAWIALLANGMFFLGRGISRTFRLLAQRARHAVEAAGR